jgi:CMP-N-acetylneuraminic acid synthetase
MKIGKLVAHIPARGGSKRVQSKNLRYLGGKPLIAYAVECALQTPELTDVYVNTDSAEIALLGTELGIKVYRRPSHLGTDKTSGEEFTVDFIEHFRPDTLLMISPVCPLIEPSDISAALRAYEQADADTLISCATTNLQTFCRGRAVNVDLDGPLAPSQENPPVLTCNWAVTIWNADVFRELFAENGSGYFGRHRLLWPIDPMKAVKISTEHDFRLAERLVSLRSTEPSSLDAKYWTPFGGSDDAW